MKLHIEKTFYDNRKYIEMNKILIASPICGRRFIDSTALTSHKFFCSGILLDTRWNGGLLLVAVLHTSGSWSFPVIVVPPFYGWIFWFQEGIDLFTTWRENSWPWNDGVTICFIHPLFEEEYQFYPKERAD